MATAPPVSVVTPFYNTDAYLAQCIESVLAQTFRQFEYILVDNHSTDRSASIAAEYARRDSRIRVVKTERFLTQVQNYNFALEQSSAESQYCKIVQADDWLFPRCLEEMVAVAEAHPTVAMVGSYRLVEDRVDCTGLHPTRSVISGREACRLHLLGKAFLFGSPSTVLYRADVVRARRPFFAEGRLHEDTEAAFEILAAHDFGFAHQVLSFSRRQDDSLMMSAHDFLPHVLDRYIVVKQYADSFLDPGERKIALHHATAWYYSVLAQQWLGERLGKENQAFWEYQRRGLTSIGEELRYALLAKHGVAFVLKQALSPLEMIRAAKRRRSAPRTTE